MKKTIMILLATGSLGLGACANMTDDQRFGTGALAGGAAGLAASEAMDSSGTGKAIGTLAGAAAGGALAANSGRKQCRYSDGSVRPCPVGY